MDLELELINVFGELWTEKAFAVFDEEADFGLGRDQFAYAGVLEKGDDFCGVAAFDDELFVELGVADGDVLHAEVFAEVAEKSFAIDVEAEVIWVHVWGAEASVTDDDFSSVDLVNVEGDGPVAMGGLNFGAVPEFAGDVLGLDLGGELAPDFFAAGAEPLSECGHGLVMERSGGFGYGNLRGDL